MKHRIMNQTPLIEGRVSSTKFDFKEKAEERKSAGKRKDDFLFVLDAFSRRG